MAYELEVTEQEATIKQQMEETRSSLADKLESLEQHVLGTVHETTSAVTGTVENVKETVENVKDAVKETVENVKETVMETFDLRLQTERHPWAVFGGSVALGFAVGHLMPRLLERPGLPESNGYEPELVRSREVRSEPISERPSIFRQLLPLITEAVGPEIERLKSYATEAFKGMVHDFVAKSVPGYDPEQERKQREGRHGEEPWHSQ